MRNITNCWSWQIANGPNMKTLLEEMRAYKNLLESHDTFDHMTDAEKLKMVKNDGTMIHYMSDPSEELQLAARAHCNIKGLRMDASDLERLTRWKKIELPPKLRIYENEIAEWIKQNLSRNCFCFGKTFFFENKDDLVAFQLRWL